MYRQLINLNLDRLDVALEFPVHQRAISKIISCRVVTCISALLLGQGIWRRSLREQSRG